MTNINSLIYRIDIGYTQSGRSGVGELCDNNLLPARYLEICGDNLQEFDENGLPCIYKGTKTQRDRFLEVLDKNDIPYDIKDGGSSIPEIKIFPERISSLENILTS